MSQIIKKSHILLSVEIIKLATPLILSMTGFTLMQFVDALFLSWYSAEAIAAVVPAGLASYLVISPFQGTAAYTATFVAHYIGAHQSHRAHQSVWQGVYFSIGAGVLVFLVGFFSDALFFNLGHTAAIAQLESDYFAILCWGAIFMLVSSAFSGYFSGRAQTALLMWLQLSGFAINALLDYLLIFGNAGFPRLGVKGAAIATVIAQAVGAFLTLWFFVKTVRKEHGDSWFVGIRWIMLKRLMRFGIPGGLRIGFEVLVWTLFLFIIGRMGPVELAASSIAFRVNGFAFFPIIGISQAVSILVGQAQGSNDPGRSLRVTYIGTALSELWMIGAALFFILMPLTIFSWFRSETSGIDFNEIVNVGRVILRFVAIYSLLDALNIVIVSALQAAGDTKWTMACSFVTYSIFLSVLLVIDRTNPGIVLEWGAATVFVVITALIWLLRFNNGAWKKIKVIEPHWQE